MQRANPPTNLLLDLGNVLVGVDPASTLRAFSRLVGRDLGDEEQSFAPLLEANQQFDAGAIGAAEFRAAVRDSLQATIDDAAIDDAWCAMIVLLPQTAGLIEELAREHRLFMLSNTDPIHFAEVRRRCGDWLSRFTGLFLSYEARVVKPNPEFFETALARFGLDAGSCLFLDDREENVEAALGVGIAAHRVEASGLERARLVEWGILPA